MGRTLTLTNLADRFTQGLSSLNIEIRLFTRGGNDTVILNRTDDLGGGNYVETGSGNDAVLNLKESGNLILLGSGNDTYVGRGFGSFATDAADTVRAGGGNDKIAVETFKSRYFGDDGNDIFFSVGWRNTFTGGSGTDTISYEPRGDDSTLGGSAVEIDLASGIVLTSATRSERLFSIENATGSSASDIIRGSSAANRIEGAGGFDILTGRGGADRFVFARASDSPVSTSVDIVTDFTRSQGDRIDLQHIDANTRVAGNQSFTYIGSAAFTGVAGQLQFTVQSDGLMIRGDTNGDRVADFRIGISHLTGMLSTDFIL